MNGAREGKGKRRSARARAAIGLAAIAVVPACAFATDRFWVGNSGNWNTANNWNTVEGGGGSNGVPGNGDNVYIRGATSRTITLNKNYTAPTAIGQLLIDSTSPAVLTLAQSANNLFTASEYIGVNGLGLYNQSGGGNTTASFLVLGYSAGSAGTYSL